MTDHTAEFAVMLALQDEMNSRVDADWRDRRRAWWRAIWVECAELMDHYGGWKWWKHTECDRTQVLLEIVDIWHFGLSIRLERDGDVEAAAAGLEREWRAPAAEGSFHEGVEAIARHALVARDIAVEYVPGLLADVGCGFDDLYANYVGKNVLNVFRQDHGYREGTYSKVWNGCEDNVHLSEVLADIDLARSDLKEAIYDALAVRYATIVTLA